MMPLSQSARSFQHGKYRHYKGNEYQTHFIARQEDTHEEMVVYQDLSDREKVWCRPLTAFLEKVEVDGQIISRFQKID